MEKERERKRFDEDMEEYDGAQAGVVEGDVVMADSDEVIQEAKAETEGQVLTAPWASAARDDNPEESWANPQHKLTVPGAYARLCFPTYSTAINLPDSTILNYYQSLYMGASPQAKHNYTAALRTIALDRSSEYLMQHASDATTKQQQEEQLPKRRTNVVDATSEVEGALMGVEGAMLAHIVPHPARMSPGAIRRSQIDHTRGLNSYSSPVLSLSSTAQATNRKRTLPAYDSQIEELTEEYIMQQEQFLRQKRSQWNDLARALTVHDPSVQKLAREFQAERTSLNKEKKVLMDRLVAEAQHREQEARRIAKEFTESIRFQGCGDEVQRPNGIESLDRFRSSTRGCKWKREKFGVLPESMLFLNPIRYDFQSIPLRIPSFGTSLLEYQQVHGCPTSESSAPSPFKRSSKATTGAVENEPPKLAYEQPVMTEKSSQEDAAAYLKARTDEFQSTSEATNFQRPLGHRFKVPTQGSHEWTDARFADPSSSKHGAEWIDTTDGIANKMINIQGRRVSPHNMNLEEALLSAIPHDTKTPTEITKAAQRPSKHGRPRSVRSFTKHKTLQCTECGFLFRNRATLNEHFDGVHVKKATSESTASEPKCEFPSTPTESDFTAMGSFSPTRDSAEPVEEQGNDWVTGVDASKSLFEPEVTNAKQWDYSTFSAKAENLEYQRIAFSNDPPWLRPAWDAEPLYTPVANPNICVSTADYLTGAASLTTDMAPVLASEPVALCDVTKDTWVVDRAAAHKDTVPRIRTARNMSRDYRHLSTADSTNPHGFANTARIDDEVVRNGAPSPAKSNSATTILTSPATVAILGDGGPFKAATRKEGNQFGHVLQSGLRQRPQKNEQMSSLRTSTSAGATLDGSPSTKPGAKQIERNSLEISPVTVTTGFVASATPKIPQSMAPSFVLPTTRKHAVDPRAYVRIGDDVKLAQAAYLRRDPAIAAAGIPPTWTLKATDLMPLSSRTPMLHQRAAATHDVPQAKNSKELNTFGAPVVVNVKKVSPPECSLPVQSDMPAGDGVESALDRTSRGHSQYLGGHMRGGAKYSAGPTHPSMAFIDEPLVSESKPSLGLADVPIHNAWKEFASLYPARHLTSNDGPSPNSVPVENRVYSTHPLPTSKVSEIDGYDSSLFPPAPPTPEAVRCGWYPPYRPTIAALKDFETSIAEPSRNFGFQRHAGRLVNPPAPRLASAALAEEMIAKLAIPDVEAADSSFTQPATGNYVCAAWQDEIFPEFHHPAQELPISDPWTFPYMKEDPVLATPNPELNNEVRNLLPATDGWTFTDLKFNPHSSPKKVIESSANPSAGLKLQMDKLNEIVEASAKFDASWDEEVKAHRARMTPAEVPAQTNEDECGDATPALGERRDAQSPLFDHLLAMTEDSTGVVEYVNPYASYAPAPQQAKSLLFGEIEKDFPKCSTSKDSSESKRRILKLSYRPPGAAVTDSSAVTTTPTDDAPEPKTLILKLKLKTPATITTDHPTSTVASIEKTPAPKRRVQKFTGASVAETRTAFTEVKAEAKVEKEVEKVVGKVVEKVVDMKAGCDDEWDDLGAEALEDDGWMVC